MFGVYYRCTVLLVCIFTSPENAAQLVKVYSDTTHR